ncbi:MAG: PglZ domain-containing protein [Methanosarcinales archaeon]
MEEYQTIIDKFNIEFAKFLKINYVNILESNETLTTADFIHEVFKKHQFEFDAFRKIFVIVFDCMSMGVWNLYKNYLEDLKVFDIEDSIIMFSVVPSLTEHSRTAIFSGKLPIDTLQYDEQLNFKRINSEEKLFLYQMSAMNLDGELYNNAEDLREEILNAITNNKKVIAFILRNIDDAIHERRADSIINNLLPSKNIKNLFKKLSEENALIFITSDHGFIRKHDKQKLERIPNNIGRKHERVIDYYTENVLDKQNILNINAKEWNISNNKKCGILLKSAYLPISQTKYVHGGISLQEMILPCAILRPKEKTKIIKPSVTLKDSSCTEKEESRMVFEIFNPNPISIRNITFETPIESKNISNIEPKSNKVIDIVFIPKKAGKYPFKVILKYEIDHKKGEIVELNTTINIEAREGHNIFDDFLE